MCTQLHTHTCTPLLCASCTHTHTPLLCALPFIHVHTIAVYLHTHMHTHVHIIAVHLAHTHTIVMSCTTHAHTHTHTPLLCTLLTHTHTPLAVYLAHTRAHSCWCALHIHTYHPHSRHCLEPWVLPGPQTWWGARPGSPLLEWSFLRQPRHRLRSFLNDQEGWAPCLPLRVSVHQSSQNITFMRFLGMLCREEASLSSGFGDRWRDHSRQRLILAKQRPPPPTPAVDPGCVIPCGHL